jgi:large repetitive protein
MAAARPVVSGIAPASGPATGGQTVTISGANFAAVRQVLFGGRPASSFAVGGYGTLTAVVPPATAGAPATVDVRVVGPGGSSAETATYAYEPTSAPTPTPTPITVAPSTGPAPTPTPAAAGCVVPSLCGLTLARARARLTAAGCRLSTVRRRAAARRHRGRVIAQSHTPGARLAPGARVSVTIGGRRDPR